MDKEQKIINFMGEWTPEEWSSFELKYRKEISKINSDNKGIEAAVNYSRKVLKIFKSAKKKLVIIKMVY